MTGEVRGACQGWDLEGNPISFRRSILKIRLTRKGWEVQNNGELLECEKGSKDKISREREVSKWDAIGLGQSRIVTE